MMTFAAGHLRRISLTAVNPLHSLGTPISTMSGCAWQAICTASLGVLAIATTCIASAASINEAKAA